MTKAFCDHQLRGIDIEPLAPLFERLVEQGLRDINLQVLVSNG